MARVGARRAIAAAWLIVAPAAAWAQQQSCAGTFESLTRQSDPRLRTFLQGIWQSEEAAAAGTRRRTIWIFQVDGTFTRDDTVCTGPGACQPSVTHGNFAVASAAPGVVALALSESGADCSVSRLTIRDNDTLDGGSAPLRRLQ
jgi:hypothetical protein